MVKRHKEKERVNKQKLNLILDEWQKVLTGHIDFTNLSKPELARTAKNLEILLKASL